jgi:hypothetical protein
VDDDVDNFLRKIWTFSYELGFHVVELVVNVDVDARWPTVGIYSHIGQPGTSSNFFFCNTSGIQNFKLQVARPRDLQIEWKPRIYDLQIFPKKLSTSLSTKSHPRI